MLVLVIIDIPVVVFMIKSWAKLAMDRWEGEGYRD